MSDRKEYIRPGFGMVWYFNTLHHVTFFFLTIPYIYICTYSKFGNITTSEKSIVLFYVLHELSNITSTYVYIYIKQDKVYLTKVYV